MVGFAPRAVVAGPLRLPFPYGLFSVVSFSETSLDRWQNSVTWEPLGCDPVSVVVGDCDEPEGFPKEFADWPGLAGEANPFTVYGTYKCNPIGHPIDYAQDRAREVLLAREEAAVERTLWEIFGRDPDATTVTGADLVDTLGLLEKWIADNYGSLGVIHVSRNAAITLSQKHLISASGGRMTTNIGTPVSVGAGYPGTAAADGAAPAAGTEWIAATPAMFGYRSEVFASTNRSGDLLDRTTNDLYGIAERTYLVGYDSCGVAFAALPLGCC